MTPLDQFIARWADVDMPVPYIDVINTNVDTDALPDVWGSAMLQSETRADITMGSFPFVDETGVLIVGLFARSGTGRNTLDTTAELLRDFFHGYVSADQSIHFTAVVGPEDIDPEGDGNWWRLGFTVSFIVQDQRVEDMEIVEVQLALVDFHHLVHFEIGQ